MSDQLPILTIVAELKEKLESQRTVILQAPPGTGKSTILPLQLLDQTWLGTKKIILLEPRRLAARAVANRMATLIDDEVGGTVGYRIRFENKVSAKTQIEVVTEGVLTRMLQDDTTLAETGLVIFDEFHERSLHADLALALCYQVQQIIRDDLRILIMSATLDSAKLATILGNAPIISCTGKLHPITIHYLNTDTGTQLPASMLHAINKALASYPGDVLAFLPGAGEIKRTKELLEDQAIDAAIYALYGDLPLQKQQEAIMPHPSGKRKVVLSTSIAETSLTIEGVHIVIDCGYARVPRFDPRTELTRLDTLRVTKDAADQRAGRAGRLGPGVCFRLWSEGAHHHLNKHRTPEILEADLTSLLLELYQWGIKDVNEITWVTPPPAGAIKQARELLSQLGTIADGRITPRGKEMLRLPTHPRIAHMLLEAKNENTSSLIALSCDVAALLEQKDPLPREAGTDFTLRIEILRRWRKGERVNADYNALEGIERVALAWRKLFKVSADNSLPEEEVVGKLLSAAYPERIARQLDKRNTHYRLVNGRIAKLLPDDQLIRAGWLSIAQMDAGTSEGKIFLAAPLNPDDVMHLAESKEVIAWDANLGMLTGTIEKKIGNISVESKPLLNISDKQRIAIICSALRDEGLNNMLNLTEETANWQARVLSLRAWRPDEAWPDVSIQALSATAEEWLAPYLSQINKKSELQRLDITTIFAAMLPWELSNRLEQLAPAKLKVPSGSMIRLRYFNDGSTPEMPVRLQEVFGMMETPRINEGRTKVLMHLLSPGYRPVQVTQDLNSFWNNAYNEVRKELRVRYQKHHWPENPFTAQAVSGVKRNLNNPPKK